MTARPGPGTAVPGAPAIPPGAGSDTGTLPLALDELAAPPETSPLPEAPPRAGRLRAALAAIPWPLFAVLAVQAGLSLRLVWTNTAFEDEALYLWAGHLEWAHWLHGTPIPPFPTYFSGAPVIYPPIAALADSIGGLALARLLSLAFMLGATALLWATAQRLYSERAAFFAAALWALLGPTIRLGAFATYDAMALFLVALAAWFATGGRQRRDATGWMLAGAAALTLANATKYATGLFDPVVAGMAVLAGYPRLSDKGAWRRGAFLASCVTVLIIGLLQCGQGWYVNGVDQTTLARHDGGTAISVVLVSSWDWIGVVTAAAAISAVLCLIGKMPFSGRLLVLMLAGAALLVPIEQARIHTYTSLSKHVDFGAWFAAIAAGYGADRMSRWARPRLARAGITAILAGGLAPVAMTGYAQAAGFYSWPDASYLVLYLRHLVSHSGRFLADNSPTLEYYLRDSTSWQQWSSVYGITLPSGRRVPVEGNSLAPYRVLFAHHYFKLVILAFSDKPQLDKSISAYLDTDPSYRFLGVIPFANPGSHGRYLIWEYAPAAGAVR